MGDTSPPQPQPAGKHRTTRQETVEPSISALTTTAAAPPTSTHGTTASKPSRKDALLSHKRSRSNNSQGHAASSTITTTNTTLTTTAGHSNHNHNNNNNNKRHSHTVTNSKTRPMMRSVSNQSQHHQEPKQQHSPTAAHSTATTATTKSERRARTSTEQRKKGRPKFVCGDHADEDLSSDQPHQEQHTHSHGAATGKAGEGEGEEEGTEAVRELEHDGYHPYHPPRHKHHPYPVAPTRHHTSLHQNHHLPPTEAAGEGGGRRGVSSQAVSSQQGNLDPERGPISESIPNNSQRPHLLPRPPSIPPPAPMRATEKEQEKKQQSEITTIRLTAPDAMTALPTSTRKENMKKKTNGPFVSSSSPSSAEESDVSVTRAKLTNLTLVRQDEQGQQQQRKQDERISKDTTLAGKDKGVDNINNNTETTLQPKVPELVVHSTSTTSTHNLAGGGGGGGGGRGGATVGGHLQSSPQPHSHPTPGVAAAITSPSQQPSERLTRLLNPSLSTTSLPSLSKTTSQPVVAFVCPNHHQNDSIVDNADSVSSHKEDSSPSQQDTPSPMTAAASAVDLVSKLLNPVVTLGRSRSHSSLHSMFTNALSGSPSSSSATTGQHRPFHARHGSAASLAGSVKCNPASSSTGMSMMGMGFMTSPPRVADPNVYLISRFITPASQQQAALSSSAPKQQAGSLSGSSSTGSLATRRRLPASLRMTSSDMDVPAAGGRGGPPAATAAASAALGTVPTSPDRASTYSSAEGPTPTHSHSATPLPPHSSFPSSNHTSSSPWNPEESMSRTQQKLNLQRDSSYDDLDEQEMARRGRVHKEMERIQREYKCIRMTSDPVMESMSRCFALQKQQQLEQQSEVLGGRGGSHGDEARSF
ncbi:hypothetical protein BGZ90_012192 [Linnemannia elongata]|nr:hypothetical protein BGZ90_012192 [Linnemannia elongata]